MTKILLLLVMLAFASCNLGGESGSSGSSTPSNSLKSSCSGTGSKDCLRLNGTAE